MIPRLRWALVRAVWTFAGCTTILATYAHVTPRFY
jgi:hypothetical protein